MIIYKDTLVREAHLQTDKQMVKDCQSHYSNFNLDHKSRVLDLGANIGGFAVMALKAGVAAYCGVEPDEDNFNVLGQNIDKHWNGKTAPMVYKAVATMSNEPTATLVQNTSIRNKCSGSVTRKLCKNSVAVKVQNLDVVELIRSFKPTHVKIDIEGAEWGLLNSDYLWPSSVKQIAVELHNARKITEYAGSAQLEALLHDYTIVKCMPQFGIGAKDNLTKLPGFLIHRVGGTLFGLDLFLERNDAL
jgi:FkbM family methyltransferase